MKNKLYTVHAYRWGDRSLHSYTVGVYSRKMKAISAANAEEEFRGGKYECEILEWDVDNGMEKRHQSRDGEIYKTIRGLDDGA